MPGQDWLNSNLAGFPRPHPRPMAFLAAGTPVPTAANRRLWTGSKAKLSMRAETLPSIQPVAARKLPLPYSRQVPAAPGTLVALGAMASFCS